jgi:spoIIIJ-associated protein
MNQEETLSFAKKYLEDMLAFFEVNVDVEVSVDGEMLYLNIPNTENNSILIGRSAETLRSFQYLLSTVLRNNNAYTTRVNIDIADYKKQRAEKIAEKARGWIDGVRKTGNSYTASLNAADRRIVHQVATEFEDIETFSEGEGRERKIVISQKNS